MSQIMTDQHYATIAEALMDNQGVTRAQGSMHLVSHLRVDNKIFSMLVNENLVVRLPRSRAEALIASGAGSQFDPGHGRAMSGWVAISPDAHADWMTLSREALDFVGGKFQPLIG